jgi:hypothetical protein
LYTAALVDEHCVSVVVVAATTRIVVVVDAADAIA